jgi:hypothetical protein
MKIIFEQEKEEDYVEIWLSEIEIKDLLSYHPVEGILTSEEEFRKPLNVFIRRK